VSPDAINAGLLTLRIAVGIVFLAHGLKHFKNRSKTITWTESIGFKQGKIQWVFMTFAEIGIGLTLITGLLTGVAAAAAIAMMSVAFWTVHRSAGFFITARPDEGYEYVVFISMVAGALAVMGPGDWSIDHVLELSLDGWVGVSLAVGGVAAAVAQLAIFYRPSSVT
jgi:putative oxidoreductase